MVLFFINDALGHTCNRTHKGAHEVCIARCNVLYTVMPPGFSFPKDSIKKQKFAEAS